MGKLLVSSREEPTHTSGLSDMRALYNYLYKCAIPTPDLRIALILEMKQNQRDPVHRVEFLDRAPEMLRALVVFHAAVGQGIGGW